MPAPPGSSRFFVFGVRSIVMSWAIILLFASVPTVALTTGVHITELMAGANGASRVQFLVIEQQGSAPNTWGPQGGETQSRAMLTFYDAAGRETGIYKFPSSPSTGGSFKTLVATADFAALPGAPVPDVTIPPLMHALNGRVCFLSNPSNGNQTPIRDCVSYGSVVADSGSNLRGSSAISPGAAAAALAITDTFSLKRTTDTGRNSDFALNTAPTPTNIAGATFTMTVASAVSQGEHLFNEETFEGNGRTCATCHVRSQSFGLQPFSVKARFNTVSTTYDPLFIAETTSSVFDAGFDYNLNTLTLTAQVATDAPCTGELAGIVSSPSSGGRAKVIARTSATTYLVGGGLSPALSGTVTDGTCSATVSSVAAGSLGAVGTSNGLENPSRMRRTQLSATSFPVYLDGRALILENIDSDPSIPLLKDNAPVFRKSPHLLNLAFTAPFGFSGSFTLREFSDGAIRQHFPRTLQRATTGASADFRTTTDAEAIALEAFQLAQEFPGGSDPNKFDLSRFVTTANPSAVRGQAAFFGTAKCSRCHSGKVLAEMGQTVGAFAAGTNGRFDTGIVNQNPLINGNNTDNLPCEPPSAGTSSCGTREFHVPQLFNISHLGPYFHDASVGDLTQAITFYNTPNFNNSPAGLAIGGIRMNAVANGCVPGVTPGGCTTIADIRSFLESLTTTTFTDDPLQPGVTPLKAVHVTELRTAIDARRAEYGLSGFSWTDSALTANSTGLKGVHIAEMRTAISAAYTAAGLTAPVFLDPIISGSTPIRLAHLVELRAAVTALTR